MKTYQFSQNNSGGSFITDSVLCHRLFIEAPNAATANAIAQSKGVYFDGCENGTDCPCCGDRWYEADEGDAIDLQSLSKSYDIRFPDVRAYAQHLANQYGWTKPDARILHHDGTVTEVFKSTRP